MRHEPSKEHEHEHNFEMKPKRVGRYRNEHEPRRRKRVEPETEVGSDWRNVGFEKMPHTKVDNHPHLLLAF